MNKELYLVFLPAISWLLFALGGTQISDKIKGWKGWRRFILPTIYFVACLLRGIVWWKVLLVSAITGIVFLLPYGDKTPYPIKFLVGCGYGCISLPIGFSAWNVITAIGFIVLFVLSNTKLTSKIFVWKICEGFFGLLVGIQIAYQLTK